MKLVGFANMANTKTKTLGVLARDVPQVDSYLLSEANSTFHGFMVLVMKTGATTIRHRIVSIAPLDMVGKPTELKKD
jgi:hypothetical protein